MDAVAFQESRITRSDSPYVLYRYGRKDLILMLGDSQVNDALGI
jgi:hypothetical protein